MAIYDVLKTILAVTPVILGATGAKGLPTIEGLPRERIVAYRGETLEEPGNTVMAVRYALTRGFPVAVDALFTADGELIASSDESFMKRNWKDDLEHFDAGTLAPEFWPNSFRGKGYKIAKMEEVFAEMKPGNVLIVHPVGDEGRIRAALKGRNVEFARKLEVVNDPVKAAESLKNGRVFSTGAAKLYTQLEGYLSRERVLPKLRRRQLVAHAGGREEAPENTLAAFKCMQNGGFGVECDLAITKDGVPFMSHDSWMNRPGSGIYDKMRSDVNWHGELEHGDAGWWKGAKWKGEPYCTLERFLDTVDNDRWIVFHMQTNDDRAYDQLKEGLAKRPDIKEENLFFFGKTDKVRTRFPNSRVGGCPLPRKGWMQHDPTNDVMGWARGPKVAPIVGFAGPRWDNELITKEYVSAMHERGFLIDVWAIDDPYIALAAFNRGVDMVCTDRPKSLWAEMHGEQEPSAARYSGALVDAVLDEDLWNDATWHSDFRRLRTREANGPIARKTEFAIVPESGDLLIGVRCYLEPEMLAKFKASGDHDLWNGSDSAEFFLSPGGVESEYYHFGFSPMSKDICTEYFAEAGNIQPDPYMPDIEAKTRWTDFGWEGEMRIPLTAFYMTRQVAWKYEWLVNVCRTSFEPHSYATWSPLEKSFHEPGNFRRLDGMPHRPAVNGGCIRTVTAFITEKTPEGILRGNLTLEVYSEEAGDFDLRSSAGYKGVIKLAKGDNTVKVPCEYSKDGRIRTHFVINRKGGGAVVAQRTYPVWVEYRPVSVKFAAPAFRNNFYPGQDASVVEGTVEILGGADAVVTIEGEGFGKQSVTVKGGRGSFSFDTRGFRIGGEARLSVSSSASSSSRKEDQFRSSPSPFPFTSLSLRRLAPSAHSMSWIENGNVVVDGRPVIKRAIYADNYKFGKRFSEFFNTPEERGTFALTPECDRTVSITPDTLIPGLERKEAIYDEKPSPEVFAALDRVIKANAAKDFFAYYISDEPECRGVSPVYLRYVYDYVTEKDPYHLVYTASRGGKAYAEIADLLETHPYINARNAPEGRRYDHPLQNIGRFVTDFGVEGRPDKVVGFLPTAFAYRWQTIESDYPTFDEYLVHTWTALMAGAKTVWPYAGHDLGDRASVYEGVRYVFRQVAAYERFLLFGKRECSKYENGVRKATWTLDGETLAVTVDYDRMKVKIEAPAKYNGTIEPYETVARRVEAAEKARKGRDNQLRGGYYEVKVDSEGWRGNFGGGIYKLFDGTLTMLARETGFRTDSHIDLEFTKRDYEFDRVVVHGSGLIGRMEASVPDGKGGFTKLAGKTEMKGRWCAELRLDAKVKTRSVRLSFPGDAQQRNEIELYEIEIPR